MNLDENVDLLIGKKSSAKSDRRNSNARSPETIQNSDELSTLGSPSEIPIRTRKTGGWADEGNKSIRSKGSNIIEQERFLKQKAHDSEDDIPVIPDIDDIQDENLNLNDVKVPNVTVKQSTYTELDNESKQLNFKNMGDIDLSVLTNMLYPEKEVQKSTEIWTIDELFQEFVKQT